MKPRRASTVAAEPTVDDDLADMPGSERAYQTLMRAISRGELRSGARLMSLTVPDSHARPSVQRWRGLRNRVCWSTTGHVA